MNTHQLTALEPLFDRKQGNDLPLPFELATLYGHLSIPAYTGKPYVISNFVSTLDGVVALNVAGHNGGGDISGFDKQDHMVMGLLRAIADAIIVGAGTLRIARNHCWTSAHVYPPLTEAYQQLRNTLGKSTAPLNVFVTEHGNISLDLPVFQSSAVPVLIVTTTQGQSRINAQRVPASVRVLAIESNGPLSARAILEEVTHVRKCEVVLTEGGPQLFGAFLAEKCLHELFLTLAPQVAGRDSHIERPGLVAGKIFAPEHPLWSRLISIKRGESHLFLRYAFEQPE
jgi:riboflavin biosynthesis pyrimidine reductase